MFFKRALFFKHALFFKRGLFFKRDVVIGANVDFRILQPNVHAVAEPGPWVRAASVDRGSGVVMVMFEIHVGLLPADPH